MICSFGSFFLVLRVLSLFGFRSSLRRFGGSSGSFVMLCLWESLVIGYFRGCSRASLVVFVVPVRSVPESGGLS